MESSLIRRLIDHEIRHFVALEFQGGGSLRVWAVVNSIKRTYPKTAGFKDRELEDMGIEAASKAGVPVEMGK